MRKAPTRYIVAGITDERDTCECCGKSGLKRVVVLLDLDTDEFVFYGTTCADRNTGRDDTARTARQRGKPPDRLTLLMQHHNRKAAQHNKSAELILKMANGNANAETRDEARRYFEKGAEERRKANELREQINAEAAATRAALGQAQ